MKYTNYTHRKCILRICTESSKIPVAKICFPSMGAMHEFLNMTSYNYFRVEGVNSTFCSLSTFRSRLTKGYIQGTLDSPWILFSGLQKFKFYGVLEKE